MNVAIVGGGIAGLTAAWQLHQLGQDFTLFEASGRLGGTVETVRRDGFVIELGPDGWVTEKPWAAELAHDLGLGSELISSNDSTRVTYILEPGGLEPIPDGLRMMVPTDLEALGRSPLFSPEAIAAYTAEPTRAAELKRSAKAADESISVFITRHFGALVLHKIGAPLLGGVFGGNVDTLSVRAVMPAYVAMEREHGSLVLALQAAIAARGSRPAPPIFTSVRTGTQSLIDHMAAALPPSSVRLNSPIRSVQNDHGSWLLSTPGGRADTFDQLILATSADTTHALLDTLSSLFATSIAELLPREASSAVLVAFAFTADFALPQGFGFLCPADSSPLLAGTFVDQKYAHRAPAGTRLLRAFFGGETESAHDARTDEELAALALAELRRILPDPIPDPAFHLVRRWPRSLPQYAVGHLDRMAELDRVVAQQPGLHLLGNAYRGVGLPDLIRDARALARKLAVS